MAMVWLCYSSSVLYDWGDPTHPSVQWKQLSSGTQFGLKISPLPGAVTQANTVFSILACSSTEKISTDSFFFSIQAQCYW